VQPLRLRYLSGPRRGEELLFSGPRVRIGRSRDNTLLLTESGSPASSGRHAEALVEGGVWWIVDTGSTNGTYVNGERVERRRIGPGDMLAFGDDQFIVSGNKPAVWIGIAAGVALIAAVAGATYATRRRAPLSYEQLAAAATRSVYAVAIDQGGRRSIVGTAFAVRADGVLATNAHVANLLRDRGALAPSEGARGVSVSARETLERATADAPERLGREGGQQNGTRAVVVRSDTFDESRVIAITVHPDWQKGSMRADAATLRLEVGANVVPLTLATNDAFEHLRRGMSLASFGFPAVSTDPRRPRGRLSVDVVGDVRGEYLQAGLAIAPGTSGSPVFDDQGAVVAIVAGGDFVKGANGAYVPSGSQANWAISIERVRELVRQR